jgi:hypothetical protein
MPWRSALVWSALGLNAALFLVGVYFELRPRYRTDVWSAGALCAVALLNSAALTGGRDGRRTARLRARLRRIALIANGVLGAFALLLLGLEASRWSAFGTAAAFALLLPPALSTLAIVQQPAGR